MCAQKSDIHIARNATKKPIDDIANELNIPLQVTANLHQVLTSLVLHGKGKLDHSGILQFVEDQSNIEVKK